MPSTQNQPIKENKIEIRVNVVTMQSFLWSFILDFKRMLLYLSVTFLAYIYKQNLTIIVVIQTKTKIQENSNLLPKTSEEIASTNNFIATPIIERLIKKEKMYSAFP